MPRPTPFDLIFSELAQDRFPAIRDSLAREQADARKRDAFLLDREAVALLRDVVPDQGVGEAIDQHVALLHTAYLFWADGRRTLRLTADDARRLLAAEVANGTDAGGGTWYVQFPERLVWAQLAEGRPHEPLDGMFVAPDGANTWRVLGVFGLHAERGGISVAEVAGPRPQSRARPDHTPLFSPTLAGGEAAGLHSVTGAEELIELGARALTAASRA